MKKYKNTEWRIIMFIFLLIVLAVFMFVYAYTNKGIFLLGALGALAYLVYVSIIPEFSFSKIALATAIAILPAVIGTKLTISKANKAYRKEQEELRLEEEKKYEKIQKNEWEFPAEKFYLECSHHNVSPKKTDEFSIKKVQIIAEQIYNEAGLPEKYFAVHNEKLSTYYTTGMEIVKRQNEEAILEANTPKEGIIPFEDIVSFCVGQDARNITSGIEKRKIHLDMLILEEENYIAAYEEKLMEIGALTSPSITPEKSWVTKAAIGTVVAGPVLGLLAGYNQIEKNKTIHQRNLENLNNSLQLNYLREEQIKMYKSHLKSHKDKRDYYIEKHKNCDTLVELEADENIINSIKFSNEIITKTENNTLHITMKLENVSNNKYPNMVLDGIIHAKAYCKNIFIDDVYIPLPLEGVKGGETVELIGACEKAIRKGNGYTIAIQNDSKFFLIEKI